MDQGTRLPLTRPSVLFYREESPSFSMLLRKTILEFMDSEKPTSSPVPLWPNAGTPATRKIEPSDPLYRLPELARDLGGNMDSRKVDEIVYQLQGPRAL